ncbi:MMPL family transporter [Psychrobacillus psychrodurans]|uniref:MMPL family transporter n=1 Tax=Psychrobacillus psychrodurans TaxID=126157 RepID=UPI0008E1A37E|nr:MMPL family transporter [Psychrobacillus psychrodurans]MCZ8541227.1 MMPL family transporter [Psychrobacillus psychrodurans]SFM88597.1 putative drug exporter of the RND superfamily [Psychrobacillus psychrodurans]
MTGLSKIVTRHYKLILGIWLLLFALLAVLAIRLPGLLEGDGFSTDGEHAEVMDELTKTFDFPAESLFVVFDQTSNSTIEQTLKEIEQLELAESIQSPLTDDSLYKDHVAYAMLHFDSDADMTSAVDDIREAIDGEQGVTLTGGAAINKDINSASQKDLASAEAIGLPIAIVVLLLAFGSVVAAFIPLAVGIVTVVSAFGVMTLFSEAMDLSIFVMNIIPMLGLALSIDFALLLINRYKEELANHSITEAVQTAIQTAGRSIIFSALCVFIGLGAMLVMQVEIFQNIALGGMLVVTIAVLSSVTLLPALLMLLKDRINKWTIIRVKPGATTRWRNFASFVMKRPVTLILVALIVLGIGIIPVKNMELTIPQVDSLPESYDSRQAYELMDKQFGLGEQSTVYMIAERPDGWDSTAGLEDIKNIEDKLLADNDVLSVDTIFTASEIPTVEQWEQSLSVPEVEVQLTPLMDTFVQDNKLLVPVSLNLNGSSNEAQDWVREWSEKELGVDFKLGGQPKFNQEIFDEIFDKVGWLLAIILGSTFIILMIAFRSILIPLKAIIMNIIGLASTFGILVYIFQYGHFGIEETTIALIIPVIVFSLVFGLSMDYEVFLISRIQEEYLKHQNNTLATVDGLTSTSKIITSAALIMIVITGAFAFTDVMPVKQIGVGIAIAVAIDASIIRLLLVPSLMKLFGKWNWWLPFRKGPYKAKKLH